MLLGVLLASLAGATVVTNGGFETPVLPDPSHNYQTISGTQWTHTGRSGLARGNIFGASAPNCAPAEGAQMAFLQGDAGNSYTPAPDGVTSLGQTLTGLTIGQSYTLSFQAMGINGIYNVNPFYVSVGGNDMFGLLTPPTSYQKYTSDPFIATSENMSLLFYDRPYSAGGQVTWIDDVQVNIYETPLPNLVVNGTFETPVYDDPHHDYVGGIDGSGWTRTGRGGIDRGNPYGSNAANCTPYEGAQMGFIQDNMGLEGITTLAQDVSGFTVGQSYVLRFEAKAIDGFSGVNPINVSVGGVDLLTNVTPGTEYEHFASDPFVATSETMSLVFYDIANVNSGDVTWIDDVRINPVPEPGMICLLLAGVFTAAGKVSRRRNRV